MGTSTPPLFAGFLLENRKERSHAQGLIPTILFEHRSFRKPDPFSLLFWRSSRKKDPWKEWEGTPRDVGFWGSGGLGVWYMFR